DASAAVSTSGGGISLVNQRYLIGASGAAGLTVTGESTGTYTITGLTNGTTYNIAVSAVDAYGNIGPPSIEACDFPAPVNDFWKLYRAGGGQAGGGLCAVEHVGAPIGSAAAFAGLGALALAFIRRRRR
ncbi:MAG: fibronectin type III domain-containing protein, partial [Polyangiaceae bacterium]